MHKIAVMECGIDPDMNRWLDRLARIFALITCLALSACATVKSPNLIPAKGRNCGLKVPPDEAGENFLHGTYLFIYPREVPQDYTGCQTMWADDGRKWMVLYMENGHPRILKVDLPFDNEKGKYTCLYEGDRLITPEEKYCDPYEPGKPFGNLLFQSVAPGKDPRSTEKLKALQKTGAN